VIHKGLIILVLFSLSEFIFVSSQGRGSELEWKEDIGLEVDVNN
jgi:hypothetical protein